MLNRFLMNFFFPEDEFTVASDCIFIHLKSITTHYFHFKAVSLGADYPIGNLIVEWAPKHGTKASGVIPDEKRQPSERVTPAALLASCPLDEVCHVVNFLYFLSLC